MNIKPNFLIIGAAKSGTTSLYHYLKKHPDVFMPDWKEPAFFAPTDAGGVQNEDEYLALFDQATDKKAVGEASVAYLYAKDAPQKIHNFLGAEVKLVCILRNPIDMAYSNWGHQTRQAYENLPFGDALKQESKRLNEPDFFEKHGTWVGNMAYIDRASYRKQIERYDAAFPHENLKIYIYEEFFANDLPLWDDLCDFLDITHDYRPEIKKHNKAGSTRSVKLQKFINRKSGMKDFMKAFLPKELRGAIKKKLQRINRVDQPLPPMTEVERATLKNALGDDVRWLEQRLGRDLSSLWF